jgi:hypothetical protein
MSDDRTMPMQQPPESPAGSGPPAWSRRETNADDQETILADQERVTPPTLPFGDQRRWQPSPDAGRPFDPNSVPTDPSVGAPSPSYPPAPPPSRPSVPPPQPPPGTPAYPQGPIRPVRAPAPQAPDGQAPTMIMRERHTIGTVHTLHPDTTTIGRVAGNQIALHDETVSAQHARIRREVKEGQEPVFALFDLGSRNGIFVGNQQTYKNEESRVYRHELKDGDYLLLGDTTLVFKKV